MEQKLNVKRVVVERRRKITVVSSFGQTGRGIPYRIETVVLVHGDMTPAELKLAKKAAVMGLLGVPSPE